VTAKPALLCLISSSPCEDGTLPAAVVHRTIDRIVVPQRYTQYDITDEWRIRTTAYDIDAEKGTVARCRGHIGSSGAAAVSTVLHRTPDRRRCGDGRDLSSSSSHTPGIMQISTTSTAK
jgi:hypothetical protein